MREEIRRAFDELTEAPHPAFRAAVRYQLEAGGQEGPPRAWRVAVAGALVVGLVLLSLVTVVGLLARGGAPGPGPIAATSPSSSPATSPAAASPSPTASASPLPSPSPTPAATPAAALACQSAAGGSSTSMADVTQVRVGTAAGYDRFVIQFDGPVPGYNVRPQDSSTFVQDASGRTVQLQGSTGLKVIVHGASGTDAGGHQTFTGPYDLTPGYPVLKEARQIGDFERTYSWGLGVSNPGCVRVTILTGPSRLVVDVLHP